MVKPSFSIVKSNLLDPDVLPIFTRDGNFLGDIDAREDLGRFGDARQTLRQRLRRKVIQVQVDVVLARNG